METLVDAVKKDVARREILVDEAAGVELCGVACEVLGHLFAESAVEAGDVAHGVAIVRIDTHEIVCGIEQSAAIAQESHRFGAFETAFLEQERSDEGLFRLVGLVDAGCHSVFERHASVAFHGESAAVDFDEANHVARVVDFLPHAVEVSHRLHELLAKPVVFGVENDVHQLSPVISPLI